MDIAKTREQIGEELADVCIAALENVGVSIPHGGKTHADLIDLLTPRIDFD